MGANALSQGVKFLFGGNVTSNGQIIEIDLPSTSSVLTLGVTGTFSATLAVEQSQDNGNTWTSAGSDITGDGTTEYTVSAYTNFRVKCTAFVSGNAGVNFQVAAGSSGGGSGTPGGVSGDVQYNNNGAFDGTDLLIVASGPPTVIMGLTGAGALIQGGTTGGILVDAGYSDPVGLAIKNIEPNGDGIAILDGSAGGISVIADGDGSAIGGTFSIQSNGQGSSRGQMNINGDGVIGCDITIGQATDTVSVQGGIQIGLDASGTTKLGFYGTTPRVKQSSTGVTTVAQLITLLVNYGLLS